MLGKIRRIAPTLIGITLVAFIAMVFFEWGMNATGNTERPVAGTIDGKDVPLDVFDREVNMMRERQRNAAGGELPPAQARAVPRHVWEEQVSRVIHDRVFEKMKLGASPEEVYRHLRSNPPPEVLASPHFQTDSVFDTTKFEAFLNDPRNLDQPGVRALEAHVGGFLIPLEKLQMLVEATAPVTDVEVERRYRQDRLRAVLEYAKLSPFSFPVDSSEIDDRMVSAYYEANVDSFYAEEQVDLYYVRIPKVVTEEDEREYRREMLAVKNRIEEGEVSFADEAMVQSDDEGSASRGGDLGWFGRGAMTPAFEEVAFSLDTGEISDPFKTSFGYHVVKVQQKEMKGDSVVRVKAAHILREVMPSAETLDSLEQVVETLRRTMNEEGFFEAVAKDTSLQVDTTGPFGKADPVPGIGYLSGLKYWAFNSEEGQIIESPLENDNAFFLVMTKERIDEGTLPVSMVRSRIVETLRDSIRRERTREHFAKVLSAKPDTLGVAELKTLDSLIISGVTDTVRRSGYIPGIGRENKAVAAGFAAPVGHRSDIVTISSGVCFVVKPLWKSTVDSIPWGSPEVQAARRRLMAETGKRVYFDWYRAYKDRMNIKENLDKYYLD